MLIRPEALPDELDEGYFGYVMRLNGLRSGKALEQAMREWAGCPDTTFREVTRLELTSRVAGLSVTEFVLRHTTLPLRRGITSYQPEFPHGSDQSRDMWWSTAMRAARPGTFFCEHCVREDLQFHGRSYWRRAHQIPGLIWCKKHHVPLRFCKDDKAVHNAPSSLLAKSEEVDRRWSQQTMSNQTICRYVELCEALMESRRPIPVDRVRAVLTRKGFELGYQTSTGRVRAPLLSDKVVQCCGRDWLAMVLPGIADKEEGVLVHKLDGVFYLNNSSSSTFAYVLAIAVLFKSSDDAFQALAAVLNAGNEPTPPRRISLTKEDLISAYLGARGSHKKVAERFGINVVTAGSRLNALGLPNLMEYGGRSTLRALCAFLIDELPMDESALAGRISQESLGKAVRILCIGNGALVLGLAEERSEVRSRPVRLTPDEAEARRCNHLL